VKVMIAGSLRLFFNSVICFIVYVTVLDRIPDCSLNLFSGLYVTLIRGSTPLNDKTSTAQEKYNKIYTLFKGKQFNQLRNNKSIYGFSVSVDMKNHPYFP